MALAAGLPDTANDLTGAFKEDLWYGVEELGLADEESLQRALYNQQAILRGDPSLSMLMAMANDVLARWLDDLGQGWIVRRCYRHMKAWLLHLHAGEDMAEKIALEVSQRRAEGQLFHANDPHNNATTPRPPWAHWADLPPTTEGMGHFATIFHIPPPGTNDPAALDPGDHPASMPNATHESGDEGTYEEPTPPANANHYDDDPAPPAAPPPLPASGEAGSGEGPEPPLPTDAAYWRDAFQRDLQHGIATLGLSAHEAYRRACMNLLPDLPDGSRPPCARDAPGAPGAPAPPTIADHDADMTGGRRPPASTPAPSVHAMHPRVTRPVSSNTPAPT